MGHKTHPIGFRLGSYKDWQSKWQDDRDYATLVQEDLAIRRAINANYRNAGISRVEIERGVGEINVTINTSRPGVVIGRGGQRVDEVRNILQGLTGKRIQLNIQEIQVPECDAYLVARNIADQLEKGITYRRAVKRAISQTMNAGGKGVKVVVRGRLGGREIARTVSEHQGSVPLHTIRADIDYGLAEAHTNSGKIGVKVWVYKGDILPEQSYVEGGNLEASTETAE